MAVRIGECTLTVIAIIVEFPLVPGSVLHFKNPVPLSLVIMIFTGIATAVKIPADSLSLRFTVFKGPFKDTAVGIGHSPLTIDDIIAKISSIFTAIGINQAAVTVKFAKNEITGVLQSIGCGQGAGTVNNPVFKISDILATILTLKCSLAVITAMDKITLIPGTVGIAQDTLAPEIS